MLNQDPLCKPDDQWSLQVAVERRYQQLPPIQWGEYASLMRLGVPAPAIIWPDLPARAGVVFREGARFDFAADLPADRDDEVVSAMVFLALDEDRYPVDLVAWTTKSVILASHVRAPYERRGTLDDWRETAGRLAKGHRLATLAISTALASTLLCIGGYESGGVHVCGRSSIGKTSSLRLAASVWGKGAEDGNLRSWRMTSNAAEATLSGACDIGLVIDEIGQIDGRELGAVLYMAANGSGKVRMRADATHAGGVRTGECYIFSVRKDGAPVATLELVQRGAGVAVNQLRGPCNATATKEVLGAVNSWLRAQRDFRFPQMRGSLLDDDLPF